MTFVEHIIDEIGLVGYSPAELNMILDTMQDQQTSFLCEWGTNVGQSARIFHEARVWLGLRCVIHSVEIMPDLGTSFGYERGHFVKGFPVMLHIGDGVNEGITLFHDSHVPSNKALFFLDDNHAESEVLRQMRMIAVEAPQAVMLIHDTHFAVSLSGQTRGWALHEPGVAIATFLETYDYEYEEVLVGQCMVRLWPR